MKQLAIALAYPRAYRVCVRPELTIRTTIAQDDGQAAAVVVGYGTDPASAVRDLTRCARVAARELPGGVGAHEVVGVRLTAGNVPDNDALRDAGASGIHEAKRARVPGWVAYGTLAVAVVSAEAAARRAAG
jgi:hypothetical protein